MLARYSYCSVKFVRRFQLRWLFQPFSTFLFRVHRPDCLWNTGFTLFFVLTDFYSVPIFIASRFLGFLFRFVFFFFFFIFPGDFHGFLFYICNIVLYTFFFKFLFNFYFFILLLIFCYLLYITCSTFLLFHLILWLLRSMSQWNVRRM